MDIVNILLATYNGEVYLKEQLDSIANQTYSNWFLVVYDDGSNDKTMNILHDFANEFKEKVYIKENKNQSGSAKNNFIKLMQSKKIKEGYVMFCDQDDIWFADKITDTIRKMKEEEENHPQESILVYTDLCVVDEKLNLINKSFFNYTGISCRKNNLNHIIIQNNMAGCTSMMNYNLFRVLLSHKMPDNCIMHDWWILLLAVTIGRVFVIEDAYIYYRQHSSNVVGAKRKGISTILKKIQDNDIKIALIETMSQADEFSNIYQDVLPLETNDLIKKYANIQYNNKLIRIYNFFKYRFWKHGLLRKIGQLIYG